MESKKKGKYFILLPLYCLFGITSSFAQSDNHAITYFGHIKLGKIPTSVGMFFMGKQFCTNQAGSILHPDRYFFENVTIGKIKSCQLDFTMRHDTVQSITIYLTGQKHYNAAMKQAQKQFGHAIVVMNENEESYTWLLNSLPDKVQVTLQRKSLEWGSELRIMKSQ